MFDLFLNAACLVVGLALITRRVRFGRVVRGRIVDLEGLI